MSINPEPLWQELRSLVADLGKDGGLISPSVYDTAQVLRLAPPAEGVEAGLQWLIDQQQPDGGWGHVDAPYSRTVPTLAAILTLHTYRDLRKTRVMVDAGRGFLAEQAGIWAGFREVDLLPIATEMILPYLIEEANAAGLQIERAPYAPVYVLRQQKCQQISQWQLVAGTPPAYSWEALGRKLDRNLLDPSGSVGHSPTATAAWLHEAKQFPELASACTKAQDYLTKAAEATGVDIPGVVPHAWPITGFELAYSLYALLACGNIDHPMVKNVVHPQLRQLASILAQTNGINFGDFFIPDADSTGTGIAALEVMGYAVDPQVLLQFKNGNHFYTYRHELNPSALSTAHALYALTQLDKRYPLAEEFLVNRQCSDGRWLSDKWHSSWLYTSLEVTLALDTLRYTDEVMKVGGALIQTQKSDGGWGSGSRSTRLETCYALITLQTLQKSRLLNGPGVQALQRGFDWLCHQSLIGFQTKELLWIGKELYSPYRVDRIYELSTLLAVMPQLESVQL